jgi:nucleotide-binding universal stress UspA family protein
VTAITKILVPVDLSERSVGAAAYAASLASEFGSELVFLHAIQNGWPLKQAEREIRDRVNATADGRRLLFRQDSPVSAILNTAETEHPDLILMSSRGKPALARFLDGSITAQVLRGAQCPVWVGLENLVPLSSRPIRTVLCGLSLGPRANAVLRWSANLATTFSASLSVIHASKTLESNPGLPFADEWRYWVKKMARDEIASLQAGLGTNAEVWLESGKPLTAIPPLAGQLRADLLVIGKSPQKRFLGDLRTLSYEIVSRTLCPVASV